MRCRAGEEDPDRFGHGDVKGLWFIGVNVVRDAYAVNGRETSAWDEWREVPCDRRRIMPRELPNVERLAQRPEHPPGDIAPPWL